MHQQQTPCSTIWAPDNLIDPRAELARNFHRESGFDLADVYMLCSLIFNLPTSSHRVNNGLGLGDSLISLVAHDFEMRLISDQGDAL